MPQLNLFTPRDMPWGGIVHGEICRNKDLFAVRASGGHVYCYMELVRLVKLVNNKQWIAEFYERKIFDRVNNRVIPDTQIIIIMEEQLEAPYPYSK